MLQLARFGRRLFAVALEAALGADVMSSWSRWPTSAVGLQFAVAFPADLSLEADLVCPASERVLCRSQSLKEGSAGCFWGIPRLAVFSGGVVAGLCQFLEAGWCDGGKLLSECVWVMCCWRCVQRYFP